MNYRIIDTPIGALRLVSDGAHLVRIEFEGRYLPDPAETPGDDPALAAGARQLGEYFAGRRREFDLPLAPAGTAFQREVWAELEEIPFGEVRSYRDVAQAIGRPKAVRAVGAANGRNPLPVVVPCHRVIGSNGALTGFAGGLDLKSRLLALEGYCP